LSYESLYPMALLYCAFLAKTSFFRKRAQKEYTVPIVPLIIVYAIFQRQFIEGIALTGIK